MPRSIISPDVFRVINSAQVGRYDFFPSPADWRDIWIYFLMLDRFNNPAAPPREPWDHEIGTFQGGTFEGVRQKLGYLKALGVGAIWISPVLKNPQYDGFAHHGYGIQDFLNIEPRFTSDPERARREPEFAQQELRALVDDAHAHGIYVIFDIVLNHVGNVFAYEGDMHDLPWRDDGEYTVWWRDETGKARPEWTAPPSPDEQEIADDALIWPSDLQRNEYFRRKGNAFSRPMDIHEQGGDFMSLRELVTDYQETIPGLGVHYPVRHILITAHQYLMAMYDIDGFRIDTLKYIEPDFAREFAAAIREYALTIGKKNFFTFGEVYDQEDEIARFIGRHAYAGDDLVGVDAALDFPLFFKLPAVVKGTTAPAELVHMYEHRKQVTQSIISSQGEAGGFFVTFIDNHDQHGRFHYIDPANPHRYDPQTTTALTLMFTLQGIPCLYYGTEQGLSGHGARPEAVREALWGKPDAFDEAHPFFKTIRALSDLRQRLPPLRYGRQYFRPVSGDGVKFGFSNYPQGILAFGRVVADLETIVVANLNLDHPWSGEVIVDYSVRPGKTSYRLLFSNCYSVEEEIGFETLEKVEGSIEMTAIDGGVSNGPARAIHLELAPGEVQVWNKGL